MWKKLELEMRFTVPVCGGVPRTDDVVKQWVEIRKASEAAHAKMSGVQTMEQVTAERLKTIDPLDVDDEMNKVWVGFSRNEDGHLFVRGGSLRAHIKDAAQVLGPMFKREKGLGDCKQVKVFAAKLKNALYVMEDQLLMLDENGKPVTKATGHRDATMSVMTAQGPRTCLKRVDFIEPCKMRATLQLLEGCEITQQHLAACFEYGSVHGFGQDRSLQFGRYEYSLVSRDD